MIYQVFNDISRLKTQSHLLVAKMIINDINFIFTMTMGCPLCGSMMVWLNGSISHDPPVKQYECRNSNIRVIKQPDGSYEIIQLKDH